MGRRGQALTVSTGTAFHGVVRGGGTTQRHPAGGAPMLSGCVCCGQAVSYLLPTSSGMARARRLSTGASCCRDSWHRRQFAGVAGIPGARPGTALRGRSRGRGRCGCAPRRRCGSARLRWRHRWIDPAEPDAPAVQIYRDRPRHLADVDGGYMVLPGPATSAGLRAAHRTGEADDRDPPGGCISPSTPPRQIPQWAQAIVAADPQWGPDGDRRRSPAADDPTLKSRASGSGASPQAVRLAGLRSRSGRPGRRRPVGVPGRSRPVRCPIPRWGIPARRTRRRASPKSLPGTR